MSMGNFPAFFVSSYVEELKRALEYRGTEGYGCQRELHREQEEQPSWT